ncbi:hypothetical protein Lal_00030383 [Lupinus albus]|nr:hypothetical protein Lal_00030383 [Lupinus albus]
MYQTRNQIEHEHGQDDGTNDHSPQYSSLASFSINENEIFKVKLKHKYSLHEELFDYSEGMVKVGEGAKGMFLHHEDVVLQFPYVGVTIVILEEKMGC